MKKKTGSVALRIAITFGIGNLLWQIIRLLILGVSPDWEFASAITFFQWTALGYMWLELRK